MRSPPFPPDALRRALSSRVVTGPRSHLVLAVVLLVLPLAAAIALWANHRLAQDASAREQGLLRLVEDLRVQPAAASAADNIPYPRRLPREPYPAVRTVAHLREAASAQSVEVVAVAASEQPATLAALGRVHLDITLRGSYAGIKTTLFELLSRDASRTVLQQLSLRRVPGTGATSLGAPVTPAKGDVEAQVRVTWLHRPLEAGGQAATSTTASPVAQSR